MWKSLSGEATPMANLCLGQLPAVSGAVAFAGLGRGEPLGAGRRGQFRMTITRQGKRGDDLLERLS